MGRTLPLCLVALATSCASDPAADSSSASGDASSTTETEAADPCACVPAPTIQGKRCAEPLCPTIGGSIDHDSGQESVDLTSYVCAIQALLDRTPGLLVYDLSEISGNFSRGFILISEQGTLLAGMWENQETIEVEHGLPRRDLVLGRPRLLGRQHRAGLGPRRRHLLRGVRVRDVSCGDCEHPRPPRRW